MPLYEYQCRACGKTTDVRHGFDEKNTETCPACGGELARNFSAAGIVFKGSGFYVTDSRKSASGSSAKKSAPSTSEAKSDTPAPDSTKSESKSDSSGSASKGDTAAA